MQFQAVFLTSHAPAQAVEEGDAMKVDKRRKKKAAEEADARADAVFAEEVRNMQQLSRPCAGLEADSQPGRRQ